MAGEPTYVDHSMEQPLYRSVGQAESARSAFDHVGGTQGLSLLRRKSQMFVETSNDYMHL